MSDACHMAGRMGDVTASATSSALWGDQGVSKCTVQQWVVAGKTNSHVYYITRLTAVAGRSARRDVGGSIMVACGVALDVQLFVTVTRRR